MGWKDKAERQPEAPAEPEAENKDAALNDDAEPEAAEESSERLTSPDAGSGESREPEAHETYHPDNEPLSYDEAVGRGVG